MSQVRRRSTAWGPPEPCREWSGGRRGPAELDLGLQSLGGRVKGLPVTYAVHLLDAGVIASLCLSLPALFHHTKKGQRDQRPAASAQHRGEERLVWPSLLAILGCCLSKQRANHHRIIIYTGVRSRQCQVQTWV